MSGNAPIVLTDEAAPRAIRTRHRPNAPPRRRHRLVIAGRLAPRNQPSLFGSFRAFAAPAEGAYNPRAEAQKAFKVIDDRGNELMVMKRLKEAK